MVTYVIRRLITAALLLLLITAVVFAIFFLVPRLAGATPDGLATRYVGRAAGPQQIHEVAVRLGLTDPIYVQYGKFVKGLVTGTTTTRVPSISCPAPCLGYSFINENPVLPDILDRLPVTISLALGAAILWLVGGVSAGVISALRRGEHHRPRRDGRRAGRRLAPHLLHRPAVTVDLLVRPGMVPRWRHVRAVPGESGSVGHDLILPWVTLAFLYAATYARLTRAGMLETMHEDYVRTARAKGLPERDVVVGTSCAPR